MNRLKDCFSSCVYHEFAFWQQGNMRAVLGRKKKAVLAAVVKFCRLIDPEINFLCLDREKLFSIHIILNSLATRGQNKFSLFFKYEIGARALIFKVLCGGQQDQVHTRHCFWRWFKLKGNNWQTFQCNWLRLKLYFLYLNTDSQNFWKKYGSKP